MPYKLEYDISDKLTDSYLSETEIAVDTELHGLRLFRDDVCMVQICDDKNNVSLIKTDKAFILILLNYFKDHNRCNEY